MKKNPTNFKKFSDFCDLDHCSECPFNEKISGHGKIQKCADEFFRIKENSLEQLKEKAFLLKRDLIIRQIAGHVFSSMTKFDDKDIARTSELIIQMATTLVLKSENN